jgi:fibronectin-binding autotransporter adhesin
VQKSSVVGHGTGGRRPFGKTPARASLAGSSLRLFITAVACACVWSLAASRADAQVISGTFAGPILSGSTATLVNGASIVGDISNDGTLEFALTDPLTNTFSIYGSGNVVLSGSSGTGGTITFSNSNSYSGGTTIHFGELSIVTGGTSVGSISHPAANMTVGDLNGDVGFLTISGGSVSSMDGVLGFLAGSSGTASISDGTWSMAGDFNVGYAGTGSFTMTGGSIDVIGSTLVGRDAGSTGTFTMSGGTATVGSQFQVGFGGTGTLSLTGGLLSSTDGYVGNNAGSVGTATVTTGTWTMSNDLYLGLNGGDGTLTIGNGGVVIVANNLDRDPALGTLNLNAGGTLGIGTGGATGSLNTDLLNNGEVQFNRSTDYAYANVISGSGSLVKDGAGRLTFSSANSYTGGTDIYGGTIEVASGGTIDHSSAPLNIGSSDGSIGGLDVTGGLVNASTINLFNGTLSTSSFGTVNSDTATLGNVGSGTATISSGFFNIASVMTIGASGGTGQLDIGTGGIVTSGTVGGLDASTILGSGTGSTGTVTVSDGGSWLNYGNLTVGDGGSGQLAISSFGEVLVTGTLSQGGLGTITINPTGTLRIGDGGTTGTLAATTLTNDGSLIFNSSTDTSTAAAISGGGDLTKFNTNALTLTGSSSYTGATNLNEGSLYVNGSLGATTLTGNAGTLLGGSGTIEGAVIMLSGTISPGATSNSFGTLTVGSLLMDATGDTLTEKMTTILSISGTTAGVDYDQIVGAVEGSSPLTYAGVLDLTLSGSYYADGTTFHLFNNFSSVDGDFSEIVLNAAGTAYQDLMFTFNPGSQTWRTELTQPVDGQYLEFTPSTGDLVVVPEPGTLALAAMGIAVACGAGWRRRKGSRIRAGEAPAMEPAT